MTVAAEAGLPIVGGHTVKSPEPFFGISITGRVHPDMVLTNSIAQAGDLLYLTKPIGTGLVTTALKNGKAKPEWLAEAVKIMKTLNKAASEAVLAIGRCAVTDITGYGLIGHLSQMMAASGKAAILNFSHIPFLPGAVELAQMDAFPGGSRSNLLSVEPDMLWDGDFAKYEKLLLADAQTSGGLLISVKPEFAEKLESELNCRKVKFDKIGSVVDKEKWLIKIQKS